MKARFGELLLDGQERVLRRGDVEVPLEPKVFACLEILVGRAGKLVSSEELRRKLWPDTHVGDGALRRVVNDLRRALGDTGSQQTLIRTRKRLGYVFVAEVVLVPEPPPKAAAATAAVWPFVGRERELEALRGFLEHPGGGLCFVSGEAGAGKSSLLARARALHSAGGRWLAGHCQAGLELPALWPFRELSRQLLLTPQLRASALAFTRKAGALRALPELSEQPFAEPPLRGGVTSFELGEAFAALLTQLSRNHPLVVAIEDVHWADEASIALLDAVARAARERALHVLLTFRPEAVVPGKALGQLIGRASGREGAFSLHLEALPIAALETLLRELHYPGIHSGAALALRELTAGNALLVHELLCHALTTDTALERALPPSLDHVVGQRVALLPAATQKRVEQAAVLGHEFSVELLRAAAGSASPAALLSELEPALHAGVLRPVAGQPDRLRFGHALLGDVLAARLPLAERHALHARALRALQALPASAAHGGALAVHAFEAGAQVDVEERRALCEQAGKAAFEAEAFDRAALHLGRSVQLLGPDVRDLAGAELTLLWAKARWHADDSEAEVEEAFELAAARARGAGSAELLAEAAIGNAMGDESVVDLRTAALRPAALALVDEAWESLLRDAEGDLSRLVGELPYRLAAARCWLRCEAGGLAEHTNAARLALQLAPPEPDASGRMWQLALRSSGEPGHADAELPAFFRGLNDRELPLRQRVEGLILTLGGRLMHGDLPGYEHAARALGALVELLPHPGRVGRLGQRLTAYVATALCAPITTAVIRGELALAGERFAALGGEVNRRGLSTTKRGDNNAFFMLMQLFGYQGRSAQLEPLIDQALRANPGEAWFGALFKAQFALERGEHELARTHYLALRETGFVPQLSGRSVLVKPETLVRLTDLCCALGDAEDAALISGMLLQREPYCIQDGALIGWGACARPLGELALRQGRLADAEHHLKDALARNARFGHVPEYVRSQLALAELWLTTGRERDAHAHLARAREKAHAVGMVPAVARADALTSGQIRGRIAQRCED